MIITHSYFVNLNYLKSIHNYTARHFNVACLNMGLKFFDRHCAIYLHVQSHCQLVNKTIKHKCVMKRICPLSQTQSHGASSDSLIQAPFFLSLLLAECSEPAAKLNFPPVCTWTSQALHCQSTQLAPKAEAKMFSNSKCILHRASSH